MSTDKRNIHKYISDTYGLEARRSIREFENALKRKACWENHHIFSLRCRDEGIIPQSLRIKTPVRTREGFRIAEKMSKAFLSARIHRSYVEKSTLHEKSLEMEETLKGILDTKDHSILEEACKKPAAIVHARTKERHIKKLDAMILKKRSVKEVNLRPEGLKKWVVNMTNHKLTPSQESVLSLGLNFAPTPRKLPLMDTVASVECAARKTSRTN